MRVVEKVALLAGAALALLVLLFIPVSVLQVIATIYLFGVAPGLLLLRAFLPELDWPTQLLLSSGSSWALSTVIVLFTILWGGAAVQSTVLFAGGLTVVVAFGVALWVDHRGNHAINRLPLLPRHRLLVLLSVLMLAAALRFYKLGYAEFQDDELDIANVAIRVMQGEPAAMGSDRRGPTQTILTVIFALTTGSLQEWIVRTPAALMNLGLIATVFLLVQRMFHWRVALLSALLLSIEGFVLAYGRILQMQSTLLAMMALSILALYLYQPEQTARNRLCYQALAALFYVVGLLAHYEMLLFTPVLAYLYIQRQGWRFWRRDRLGLLTMGAIVVAVGGPFYGPFLLNPAFTTTYDYYSNDIVGRTLTNNLHQFWLVGAFYNSPYYVVVLWLGLLLTWVTQFKQAGGNPLWTIAGRSILAFCTLLLGAMLVWPWAPTIVGIVACCIILALVLLAPRVQMAVRLVTLWFFSFFIPYSFFLRDVHIHYYAYSIAWTLLGGLGFDALYHYRQSPAYQRSLTVGFALFLLLCSTSTWRVFIQSMPEYALTYPAANSRWLAILQPAVARQRQGEAFGFPHKSGWKTIGALYGAGVLRGAYETNELYLKAEWYTRRQLRTEPTPRYYFVATVPHRLQAAPWPPPLDPTRYGLSAVVTVQGQPRLEIYERNDLASGEEVRYYANEHYEPQFDQSNGITRFQQEATFQADDQFFYDAAKAVASTATPSDGLIFFIPEAATIFNYYYEGNKPYYLPTRTNESALPWTVTAPWAARTTLDALFWAEAALDPKGHFERWLNTQLFKVQEQWVGNIRLVRYQTPAMPHSATIERPLTRRLGDKIRFLGYNLTVAPQKSAVLPLVQGDEQLLLDHVGAATMQLSLFWQAQGPIEQRYKVFIQLRDENNQIISQNDSEPGGGRQPTDSWPVADATATMTATIVDNYALTIPADLPAGSYRLGIGMYLPATGERLPVFDNQGQRQANDEILLEAIFQKRF